MTKYNIKATVCVAELVESAMYLYQSTKDKYWLEVGRDIADSIEHISKVPCGYATVMSIIDLDC